MRLLDPRLDIVFKLLFGAPRNEPVLIAFLTDVLEPSAPIKSATVLNPEIPKDLLGDKSIYLDVHVALSDGRFVDVEMQARRSPALRERLLYYWAKAYGAQLGVGEDYRRLCPCIGIYVLDFAELEGQDFHGVFGLFNPKTGERLSHALEMHFLELPKLAAASEADNLRNWGRFFSIESAEDLEDLVMSNPSMKQASDALWWVSRDPNSRQLAEMREMSQAAFRHTMAAARDEGLLEGRQEGLLEGRQEGLLEGRQEGLLEGRQEGLLEGRQEGLLEGHVEGLRRTIRAVACVLNISIDETREALIAGMSHAELERAAQWILEKRTWPK